MSATPGPLGPCRMPWCGTPTWGRDLIGPIHRCCAYWAALGATRCVSCIESRTAASRRAGRRAAA